MLVVVAMIHYSHLLMELLSLKERAEIRSRLAFTQLTNFCNLINQLSRIAKIRLNFYPGRVISALEREITNRGKRGGIDVC